MDPREALRHIRTLVSVAATTDDVRLIRAHLRDVLSLVEKGLASDDSNIVPLRPRTDP